MSNILLELGDIGFELNRTILRTCFCGTERKTVPGKQQIALTLVIWIKHPLNLVRSPPESSGTEHPSSDLILTDETIF